MPEIDDRFDQRPNSLHHQIGSLDVSEILPWTEFQLKAAGSPDSEKLRKLTFSKLNIFVGPNNSGKSRILRKLCQGKLLSYTPTWNLKRVAELRDQFALQLGNLFSGPLLDVADLKKGFDALPRYDEIKEGAHQLDMFLSYLGHAAALKGSLFGKTKTGGTFDVNENSIGNIAREAARAHGELQRFVSDHAVAPKFDRVYIPALRGLRRIQGDLDVYGKRTLDDYFGGDAGVEVFTGLSMYTEFRTLLLGALDERELAGEFQQLVGKRFFDGKSFVLLPREKPNELYVKIGDEAERPIYELGDGIQMIIICLFAAFKRQNSHTLIFIEEPELFMHPGMQRQLIASLLEIPRAQIFIATHSNHLLDIACDLSETSIFRVAKRLHDHGRREHDAICDVTPLVTPDHLILREIGVRNTSVFLSNCTIWVEGITDRRYIRHFLKLYCDKNDLTSFREDIVFSFVEYSGSNITHWSFLDKTEDAIEVTRLCGQLFLVADKDTGKDERHLLLKEKLGERFYRLPVVEIENLLSPSVIARVVAQYEGSPVKDDFELSSYSEMRLGKFIEERLLQNNRQRSGRYADKSGTLVGKVDFCDRAIAEMTSYEDLSTDAIDLAEKVYQFIAKHNV